ncbi:DODA-type extradiol aromatic ring-opening family dioxygenase [Hyphobacterium marinum]|uniref:Class III extradiol ring-cleavage dioxygenase n=1 Tax=Hyphobacterium marinum TaxID=3116574 RepID=A0ABU7LWI3_9PROT|nr:class III extradiol ring-cleavage dioxygenase [Hyphobacterium sp. Y6023]MEE2565924.1 class III extradiol ring-cleavage dioxygenase [Hyphobacterium sp. Y6023]
MIEGINSDFAFCHGAIFPPGASPTESSIMTVRNPLFLSHGAPSLLTGRSQARAFLTKFGSRMAEPASWIVVSAHWESGPVKVTASSRPSTIHDFAGFGEVLARYQYTANGSPELAVHIAARLKAVGISAETDANRGLDHGVWVPLALLRPQPQAPVIQVSLPPRQSQDHASAELGAALAPLAREGHQLVFSGSLTHSLRDALGAPEDAPPLAEAESFAEWARPKLVAGDLSAILDWRSAPHAARNHPTPEHFRPLIAALAASGGGGEALHAGWTHGALAMDVWRFPALAA